MELTPDQLKTIIKDAIRESNTKESKLTLTVDEATKLSGIGRDKLLELVHKDNSDFPSFKVGSKFLINKDRLINWLAKITKENRTI